MRRVSLRSDSHTRPGESHRPAGGRLRLRGCLRLRDCLRLRSTSALAGILAVAALLVVAVPAQAQVTRADTAAVLLDAARTFEAEGRLDLAEDLFQAVAERFADTEAGVTAVGALEAVQAMRAAGRGQAGYVAWSTIFGAWLGVAVPAAFGAEDPEPYGLGLLIGAPAGFFGSRAYGKATDMTVGTSRTITFSWMWGTWQGLGWQAALDLGEDDDQAPWIAAVVGGVTGYAAGIAATRAWNVTPGASEMLWHSSIWGTGYGFALGFLADLEGDDLLASTLIGGNVGLLASIPASNAWNPTSGQVRIVSVAGLAGAVAGLGVDLLFSVDSDKTAVAIPTVGATIGLLGGAAITAGDDPGPTPEEDTRGFQAALLQLDRGVHLGVPAPMPVLRSRLMPDGRTEWDPGVSVTLFQAAF